MKVAVRLVIASALCAGSGFASIFFCPGPTLTGFGNSTFGTWQTCGPVGQTGSSVTINTTNAAQNAPLSSINMFLSPQMVSSQAGIVPTSGGALKTAFTSGAGTLSFNYSFVGTAGLSSFGFLLLDGTQYDLGDSLVVTSIAPATITPSFSMAIGAGSHNIAFGLMNHDTTLNVDPTLTISNLTAPGPTGVPEPATFGLAAGALGLVFMLRRRSQACRAETSGSLRG